MNDQPDDHVTHLPPPKRRPPHIFDAARTTPKDPARGRLEQTERTCVVCGVVKITVMQPGGGAWREWRAAGSDRQFRDVPLPSCTIVPS
ncbi:MAG: hypothetical protein PS018_17160 [bacterium]|nr:hypothetical protein [bacterium]